MLLSDIFALKGEGGGVVIYSATPPLSPDNGTGWFDTEDNVLSFWREDVQKWVGNRHVASSAAVLASIITFGGEVLTFGGDILTFG